MFARTAVFQSGTLTTQTAATGQGVNVGVNGSVNVTGNTSEALDLDVKITSFPVSLFDSLASTELGQSGTLSGDATVSGALTDPDVDYDLKVTNFSIEASRGVRIAVAGDPFIGQIHVRHIVHTDKCLGKRH